MRIFLSLVLTFTLAVGIVVPTPAEAKRKVYRKTQTAPQYNPKYAAFVVDGDTGKILYQEDADKLRHPASLTKMMTAYLLFEAMEKNRVNLNTRFKVTANAANQPKTNLNLEGGEIMTVRDAMLAIIVKSANDAAVVIAENLAGSEDKFVDMMNARAKQLGMKNTHFENANGFHNPKQITTAKDMALLGIALKKHFPQYFKYFSYKSFTYNGVEYKGHNRVMENYPGADGLKTGFVNASGFNLVTTASRRGINIVGVVIGGRSQASRDAQMVKLLDYGFEKAAQQKSQTYIAADYKTKQGNAVDEEEDDSQVAQGDVNEEAVNTATAPQPVQSPVPTAAATSGLPKLAGAIDENEDPAPEGTRAKIENSETNAYVRSVASQKTTGKKDRYKSSMIIQPFNNPSTPLFVPSPKPKPKI